MVRDSASTPSPARHAAPFSPLKLRLGHCAPSPRSLECSPLRSAAGATSSERCASAGCTSTPRLRRPHPADPRRWEALPRAALGGGPCHGPPSPRAPKAGPQDCVLQCPILQRSMLYFSLSCFLCVLDSVA